MKIEFMARFERKKTPKELEDEQTEREICALTNKEYVQDTTKRYEYDNLVQDKDNIFGFNPVDKKHTALRTSLGEVFIIKGSFSEIMEKWVAITGEEVVKCY